MPLPTGCGSRTLANGRGKFESYRVGPSLILVCHIRDSAMSFIELNDRSRIFS